MSDEFEKMVAGDDGWSDWIHPVPGYLMKCCDCGLVHGMEFAISEPVPETLAAKLYNPGEGDDGVVVFRARRVEPG